MRLSSLPGLGRIYKSHIDVSRLDRVLGASNPVPYNLMQLASLIGIVVGVAGNYGWPWWLLAFGVAQVTVGMGISCGYHRLWTHQSYTATQALQWFYLACGVWTMAGSPPGFSFVHRFHHLFADKKGDPHAPSLGGWKTFSAGHGYADVSGYVESLKSNPRLLFKTRRLLARPLHRALHNWLWALAVVPPVLCWLVGGAPLVLFGWLIPSAVRLWVGPYSLWYSHRDGAAPKTRPFVLDNKACNSTIIGLLLWEGPHNNHHAFPGRWSYQPGYDPGTYFLRFMFWLGLAAPRSSTDG